MRSLFAWLPILALGFTLPRVTRAQSDTEDVGAIERAVEDSKVQLTFVKDLIDRGEVSALERSKQLFNDAETEFLLENYDGAAAGLLEAVSVQAYHSEPTYTQALYYLAESLFKTGNFVESKHYFRQAVSVMTPGKDSRYLDCVVRLIHLSELTGDAQGIDEAYEAAKKLDALRPEVIYLYAKWVAGRSDLPLADRAARADADFGLIRPGAPYYGQALYFRGALKVQLGQLDDAIGLFEQVAKLRVQKTDARQKRLRDLGILGVARCLAEEGKLEQAIETYHQLPGDSEEYVDALFERTEALVRLGNLEEALHTADSLLLLAKDTPVEPEAQILQANLRLKLGATNHEYYDWATEAFSNVVKTYKPVSQEVQAIVNRPDPVKYFNDRFRQEPDFDFTQLLPKAAQGFMDPTADVKVATGVQKILSSSADDAKFSAELAKKLLDVLSRGGMDMFPQMREASGRAVQMSNTLVRVEGALVQLQVKLLGPNLPPDVKSRFAAMDADRAKLDAKFQQLPANQKEYDRRLKGFRERIAELERKKFQVERELDQERATLKGLEKIWNDMLPTKHLEPSAIDEGRRELQQWNQLLDQLEAKEMVIDRQLATEKLSLVSQANGGKEEEALRLAYHRQTTEMQAILTRVLPTVSSGDRPLLDRLTAARAEIDRQQTELSKLRLELRAKADERANVYRQRIVAEQLKLGDYRTALDTYTPQAGQLIGQIAVDAYTRVAKQFYDIVVKGDVGIIDVAWGRKQEHTDQISKYGKERDDPLKQMQDRYKEVLSDVQ